MSGKKNSFYQRVSGSFRDPQGFLFMHEGVLYRQIQEAYREDYDHLMKSGLYQSLINEGLLIAHEEVSLSEHVIPATVTVIKPEIISFISYPYEWCFGQLRDAALLTLAVQKEALAHGMILKDGSAYNIQFQNGKPVFIDTLSFERYYEGRPWFGYRQFCEQFIAPLALVQYRDARLQRLLRIYLDGVSLDFAARLLPFRTRFSSLLWHLHLHAKGQGHFSDRVFYTRTHAMSKRNLVALLDSVERTVMSLTWDPPKSGWSDYYDSNMYTKAALHNKKLLLGSYLEQVNPVCVWDIGAHDGSLSREASRRGIFTIACDADSVMVEQNYRHMVQERDIHMLPLVADLMNPSSSLGWGNTERQSIIERGPADTLLVLALMHHLVLRDNVPLVLLADFFHSLCSEFLIIEFISPSDPQVQMIMKRRMHPSHPYSQEVFERSFGDLFAIERRDVIGGTDRVLYLMRKRKI